MQLRQSQPEARVRYLQGLTEFIRDRGVQEIAGVAMSGAPVAAMIHRLAVECGALSEESFSVLVPATFDKREVPLYSTYDGELLRQMHFFDVREFALSSELMPKSAILVVDDVLSERSKTRLAVERTLSGHSLTFGAGAYDNYAEGADVCLTEMFVSADDRRRQMKKTSDRVLLPGC